jgi:hypothetical protein
VLKMTNLQEIMQGLNKKQAVFLQLIACAMKLEEPPKEIKRELSDFVYPPISAENSPAEESVFPVGRNRVKLSEMLTADEILRPKNTSV